jgi:hypothetical protein
MLMYSLFKIKQIPRIVKISFTLHPLTNMTALDIVHAHAVRHHPRSLSLPCYASVISSAGQPRPVPS